MLMNVDIAVPARAAAISATVWSTCRGSVETSDRRRVEPRLLLG
jgi:hypothetical protein